MFLSFFSVYGGYLAMINNLITQYFGEVDFTTPRGICTFLFGVLIVFCFFNLLKVILKIIFK